MEYQKIANSLDKEVALSASNQPRGTYTSNDIKFKTTMLKSNSCDYADVYLLVNGRITITGSDDGAARRADERDKGVTFQNCAPIVH